MGEVKVEEVASYVDKLDLLFVFEGNSHIQVLNYLAALGEGQVPVEVGGKFLGEFLDRVQIIGRGEGFG